MDEFSLILHKKNQQESSSCEGDLTFDVLSKQNESNTTMDLR
jgi:hypothetical protein